MNGEQEGQTDYMKERSFKKSKSKVSWGEQDEKTKTRNEVLERKGKFPPEGPSESEAALVIDLSALERA